MKRKTPSAVVTAILTLTTIFAWVGFEVYRSFTTKSPPQVPAEIINPLDPTLDTQTLNSLGQRVFVENSQITVSSPSPTPSPSPLGLESPSPTPVATASASPSASPSPSPTP
jgi:hypothetical protein